MGIHGLLRERALLRTDAVPACSSSGSHDCDYVEYELYLVKRIGGTAPAITVEYYNLKNGNLLASCLAYSSSRNVGKLPDYNRCVHPLTAEISSIQPHEDTG
jgi:hypothetical protein